MMGQRDLPTTLWNQRQASGLIGSPTDAQKCAGEERSCLLGQASPKRIRLRMAVGAVYMMVMPNCSISCHHRLG